MRCIVEWKLVENATNGVNYALTILTHLCVEIVKLSISNGTMINSIYVNVENLK